MGSRRLAAELHKALDELKYPLVRENVPFLTRGEIAEAEVVGFSSPIPSQKSTCVVGHSCPSRGSTAPYLEALSQLGAPYVCLGFDDREAEVWHLAREKGSTTPTKKHILTSAVSSLAADIVGRPEFAPDEVMRIRTDPYPDADAPPWQLSFAATGYLDFQEEQSEKSLVGLLNESVKAATNEWAKLGDCPDKPAALIGEAFLRLIAARALADKGLSPGADPLDRDQTVGAARQWLPHFVSAHALSVVPSKVLDLLWDRLKPARFMLLTGDMLAGIYEKGLLSAEQRKKQGIHYTPHSLRRLLWNEACDQLKPAAGKQHTVLDPTCGSGGFLLTAYEGLILLRDEKLYRDHDVDYYRDHLIGIDKDPFACDISRLALILQSQPVKNGWAIRTCDFLDWKPATPTGVDLVIGNPPFKLATEVLEHALDCLGPGGVLALVMPRSFLTNIRDKGAREQLASRAQLAKVIELPDRIFRTSQASTCTVVAQRLDVAEDRPSYCFQLSALDPALDRKDQRRRFEMGDTSFAKLPIAVSISQFIDGVTELSDIWDGIGCPQLLEQVTCPHKGIVLKERKGHDSADVSDVPKAGYIPFLANARDFIDPFRIKAMNYVEWQPTKMWRPGHPEWWRPGKVVLCRAVTHRERWRLKGAVDEIGAAYDSRVIGCAPVRAEWSAYALLCLLSSSYANAWYSTHSQQGDVAVGVLGSMPVPDLTEDQLEYLAAAGQAISECAEAIACEHDARVRGTCGFATNALLREVDRTVCGALGLGQAQTQRIDCYLRDAGKLRPGEQPEVTRGDVLTARAAPNALRQLHNTTGLVLSCGEDASPRTALAIVWIDGLDIRLPVCLPVHWLPESARRAGAPIKVSATLDAPSLDEVAVGSIEPYPEAELPRDEIVARLDALASRGHPGRE